MQSTKKFNVYSQQCRSRKIFEMISDKWTILIISLLAKKTLRFGELKREIDGISQKVLTQTLRKLEENGFVSRVSYSILPLKVEYSLTELGIDLNNLFSELISWAENNVERILGVQANRIEK